MTVFTNPEDLTQAILEKVNPRPVMVPTIAEQMAELIKPGHAVAFRTESGSLYELTIYHNKPVLLAKFVGERGDLQLCANGELRAARDPHRGVVGVMITEPSGRVYTTSAIVKVWLAYDANAGKTHDEPAS